MTRRYGRSPEGTRALGKVPCNTDPNITLVVGLCQEGVVAPLAFEGAINGDMFYEYMRDNVVPELRPGDIVVADNLGAHRKIGIREMIEARGAEYWFLPAYSPELSPVEECGSKIKAIVRAEAPRTAAGVYEAMGHAIGRVTPADARGWFEHAATDRSQRSPPRISS